MLTGISNWVKVNLNLVSTASLHTGCYTWREHHLNPISCALFWYVWVWELSYKLHADKQWICFQSVWVENPLNKPRWDHLGHQLHSLVEKAGCGLCHFLCFMIFKNHLISHMCQHQKWQYIWSTSSISSGLVSMFGIHSYISFCLQKV